MSVNTRLTFSGSNEVSISVYDEDEELDENERWARGDDSQSTSSKANISSLPRFQLVLSDTSGVTEEFTGLALPSLKTLAEYRSRRATSTQI